MSAPELVAASGSVPPSLELLSYYRSRIAEFEKERELFLSKFSAVEERGDQVDRLKWCVLASVLPPVYSFVM